MTEEKFNFDQSIQLQSETVTWEGNTYTLKEASGGAVADWRNAQLDGAKFVEGKPVSMGRIGQLQALLLSRCLFDKDNKTVTQLTLQVWPDRILGPMYEWVLKVSNLNSEVDDDSTKKSSTTTKDGSD